MIDFEKKTALITGSSSGIGKAFAETLAEKGANVILLARSRNKLDDLAAVLRRDRHVRADVVVADLSDREAPERVHEAVRKLGLRVDVLINNAGFGSHGPFHSLPARTVDEMIMVNVHAVAVLTRLFLPEMRERHDGIIINVASTAAFQPTPFVAVYGATKAFVLSFSEALWGEYRTEGIRVLALCPGATATAFFETAGEGATPGRRRRTVESVVASALKALARGKSFVVDGGLNYLGSQSVRLAPRQVVLRSAARIMRPRARAE